MWGRGAMGGSCEAEGLGVCGIGEQEGGWLWGRGVGGLWGWTHLVLKSELGVMGAQRGLEDSPRG